jgi:hypothetical protein
MTREAEPGDVARPKKNGVPLRRRHPEHFAVGGDITNGNAYFLCISHAKTFSLYISVT